MEEQKVNKNKFADVPIRVKSWGVIILIFTVALLHPVLMCLFVCFLSFQGLKEFIAMFSSLRNRKTYYILCVLIVPLSMVHLVFIGELNIPTQNIRGINALILLVLLTELNDVFQYLSGKFFGKKKITPRISPNKTWEGFLGGLVLTIGFANLLSFYLLPDKGFVLYSIMGLLIGVFGFCGDIYISSIKRYAGVKDTGNLIPGHGGLLDRIDSLLFITPVYYWLLYLMYIY